MPVPVKQNQIDAEESHYRAHVLLRHQHQEEAGEIARRVSHVYEVDGKGYERNGKGYLVKLELHSLLNAPVERIRESKQPCCAVAQSSRCEEKDGYDRQGHYKRLADEDRFGSVHDPVQRAEQRDDRMKVVAEYVDWPIEAYGDIRRSEPAIEPYSLVENREVPTALEVPVPED